MQNALKICALALSMAAPATTAQSQDACAFEPAFGKITNRSEVRIVDLCIDRATGTVTGPMAVDGLTLVMDDGVNFTFEDLNGSANIMMIAPVLVENYHGGDVIDQSPEINVMQGSDFFVGFLYDELAGPADLAANFYVSMAIDGPTDTLSGPIGFTGETQFLDGVATITVMDSEAYGTSKDTTGTVTLTVAEDGTVTGSGTYETSNIRSAGYGKDEWVSMTVTLDELRGFATGPTGQVIKSYGLVTVDIIDAEGDARQETGVLGLFLYDPEIWE